MIMIKADVGSVRRAVSKHIGSKVVIRSNLGRHRVDVTEGIIMDTYPSIFLISVKNGFEDTFQTVSFSYTDVLTHDVQIKLNNFILLFSRKWAAARLPVFLL